MLIFHHQAGVLTDLDEQPFALEKDMQTLLERNLERVLGLRFIRSEFSIKNSRIDTLAYDLEANAFVIIEFKRERNFSVIDQGVAYLSLMLEYKSDFIVEYNESQPEPLKRSDVDWSQSRVIFVAPSFTQFQKQSTNFKDLAIELWELKRFAQDIIVLNPIHKTKHAPSLKQINLAPTVSDVPIPTGHDQRTTNTLTKITQEIIVYDEAHHLSDKSDDTQELYDTFKDAILNLSNDITVIYKKHYIAFKKKRNLVDIYVQKKSLKLWINKRFGELDDPKHLARNVAEVGHLGNGDYEVRVHDSKDLEYIMSLIKQTL